MGKERAPKVSLIDPLLQPIPLTTYPVRGLIICRIVSLNPLPARFLISVTVMPIHLFISYSCTPCCPNSKRQPISPLPTYRHSFNVARACSLLPRTYVKHTLDSSIPTMPPIFRASSPTVIEVLKSARCSGLYSPSKLTTRSSTSSPGSPGRG